MIIKALDDVYTQQRSPDTTVVKALVKAGNSKLPVGAGDVLDACWFSSSQAASAAPLGCLLALGHWCVGCAPVCAVSSHHIYTRYV
jgi:hypothetical protein